MFVVANLDCEAVWAGVRLPAAVTSRLAVLATTMRVFAEDGDELWVPGDAPLPPGAPIRVAWADPGARAVNDRQFAAALAERLGVALPGARIVASVEELEVHLARGGAEASPDGSWVAKARWTAAGRDRVRRRGAMLDEPTRVRVARLIERHGALAFEPWMARTLDLGQGGHVAADGTVGLLPPHRGVVDSSGVVRGIAVGEPLPEYEPELARVGRAAGAALHAAGYRGPFVVDAFVHRDRHGDDRLYPLCELNARYTFGLVARAWADRLGLARATLGLAGPPPPGATPLVPDGSVWLSGG